MCCQHTAIQKRDMDNLRLAGETAQLLQSQKPPLHLGEDKVFNAKFLTSLWPHQHVNFAQTPQAAVAGPSFSYGGLPYPKTPPIWRTDTWEENNRSPPPALQRCLQYSIGPRH